MTGHGFFITGTDTGVGKTLVSAALLHAFAGLGYRVVGMKPVAAGAEQLGDVRSNEDVLQLLAAANVSADPAWINPYLLRQPIAPHIAADHQGVNIELPRIRDAYEHLATLADVIVVEGVGGFKVPLSATRDSADLASLLGLPIVLVVGMRLGCLNHALLTAESIAARGLPFAGWVANQLGPDMAAYTENLAALRSRLPGPLLAEFPYTAKPDALSMSALIAPKKLTALIA
ncbi:MAG: dethiobiotin synthase [Hydrogenophilales bacterium 28-61-23]|nr:MAG: dethiobiotin synthase [Hydrogenophilales bacterium 28-61-23]